MSTPFLIVNEAEAVDSAYSAMLGATPVFVLARIDGPLVPLTLWRRNRAMGFESLNHRCVVVERR